VPDWSGPGRAVDEGEAGLRDRRISFYKTVCRKVEALVDGFIAIVIGMVAGLLGPRVHMGIRIVAVGHGRVARCESVAIWVPMIVRAFVRVS